jgi:hypothetical protein
MAAHAERLIAAWRHADAREGFEVASIESHPSGVQIHGHTAAVEAAHAWSVRYLISVDRE